MFSGLSKFFKRILPKKLFYRALLIVAIPVIVIQLVITIVFFDSLWIKTNKGMTRTLVNEISAFIEAYKSEKMDNDESKEDNDEEAEKYAELLSTNLELSKREVKYLIEQQKNHERQHRPANPN